MLLALYKDLLKKAQAASPGLPVGTLTIETPYEQLHYAEIDGIGTVKVDKSGNMVGFSPVERCSFNGETVWIPLELVKNLRTEPFMMGAPMPRGKTAARK